MPAGPAPGVVAGAAHVASRQVIEHALIESAARLQAGLRHQSPWKSALPVLTRRDHMTTNLPALSCHAQQLLSLHMTPGIGTPVTDVGADVVDRLDGHGRERMIAHTAQTAPDDG